MKRFISGRKSTMSYVALVNTNGNENKFTPRRDRSAPPTKYSHGLENAIIILTPCLSLIAIITNIAPIYIVIPVAVVILALVAYFLYESRFYAKIMSKTAVDVDKYMYSKPGRIQRNYISMSHRLSSGSIKKSPPIKFKCSPSPYMENLLVTSKCAPGDRMLEIDPSTPSIIIGSIRMGFGHHRIARAASSWGAGTNLNTYFHDLLNIESAESKLIHDMDSLYSAGSRMATEIGGPVEAMWGYATLSGGEGSLRQTWLMGEALTSLVETISKDVPIVCSHSLVGMVAVAAGFKHVVNCVIDNHAQWFCAVPGAVNVVQGPSNYISFLKMGIPASELRLVGGWVPKDIVDNIEKDSEKRHERLIKGSPRRLLVPIGGAGAQRKYVSRLVRAMAPLIKDGTIELFLNAGDRQLNHRTFDTILAELELNYQLVDSFETLKEMIADQDKIKTPVVLLAFKEYFPALACTDMLIRICDVLVSKPSELAFYPIPKLSIRRVGDHEQFSANRAVEIGDGTPEARTVDDAMHWINLLSKSGELFSQMNDCVLRNHSIGLYNGSKRAVEIARKMASGEKY
mmetsp:Transcript_19532/g.27446  ORF Transcript_19532/g.27446 Transcript_19532/m.27446 type:complete len:571 (-) Transcript_19532:192-1904(-)